MELGKLIKGLKEKRVIGNAGVDIKELCANSNTVQKGALFICLNGGTFDGHNFIRQAEIYGCVAILCERELDTCLTQVIVPDVRSAMCVIASEFYGNPAKNLKIIAVTGTNGKTTTTHLIKKILDGAGIKCGVIGTLGAFYGNEYIEQNLTTPDPIALYKILYKMAENKVKVVAMEVSAHALYYNKTHGLNFEVGVLTNFTQDHLDFFKSMDEYAKAKLKLFENDKCKFCIVNSDDELGVKILDGNKIISYGIYNPSDVFAIDVNCSDKGSKFVLNLFDVIFDVDLKLIGKFNVYNAMAAATASALVGAPTKDIEYGLNVAKTVSGRLEQVYAGEFNVFVDYAHTPDGLLKSISALKELTNRKVICVFGCGGNRDSEKRAIMGEISGKYADFTVITSDNPRYEEPMDIIFEIEKGVLKATKNYVIVQDRAEAIGYAVNYARRGDIVLIAGKGSEKYQEILGIKHVFNDKDIIKEILGD